MSQESRLKYLGLVASMRFWLSGVTRSVSAEALKDATNSPPSAPAAAKDPVAPNAGELIVEPALPVVVPSEPIKAKEESKPPSGEKPPAISAPTAAKESDTAAPVIRPIMSKPCAANVTPHVAQNNSPTKTGSNARAPSMAAPRGMPATACRRRAAK